MNKMELMNNISRTFNKVGFQIKKHSPEILVTAGVVGTVASAVLACKATLKVNEITDEAKDNIEKIHEATETGVTLAGETYSVEDSKKDLTTVYIQTGVKLVKLYAPAVGLATLSLAAILKSNNILTKRNAALGAAYAAVDRGFKEYRGRVIDRFGKEVDRELRYNIKAKEIEAIVVDEKGNEVTETKVVEVADLGPDEGYSDYARFFDECCRGWERDPELNLMFLRRQQDFANEKLKSKGYMFLNEVYDLIGLPRTKAGQIVGWVYNEANPIGDNYIDFGIYHLHRERNRAFVNGYEPSILLDFNVDGNILDLI